ncbi:MAG TPA: Sua5/YciO/YrdC/YwlC family protein, partial [Gaiellaceae bacterium]|nr:Sua5/YciO/YrdC/YwlC family protein [Gaiellaceae bacterium]
MEPLRAGNGEADVAIAAIRAGKPVVLPTDTVYGLCANAYSSAPVQRAYALKGRDATQPSALLAADVDMLLECVPELRGRLGPLLRELLPAPLTIVVPNPARRYRWLTGANEETLGVRVPELPAAS